MLIRCLFLLALIGLACAELSPFCQQYLVPNEESTSRSSNQFSFPRIIHPYRHQWIETKVSPVIPPSLFDAYTRCQTINQSMMLVDESFKGKGSHFKFTRLDMDKRISLYQPTDQSNLSSKQKRSNRVTGIAVLLKTKEKYAIEAILSLNLRDHSVYQSIAVMGSQDPWLEALLIARGAKHVTTIEYNQLTINHTQITTMTPTEYRTLLQQQSINQANTPITWSTDVRFDLIIAIACADHDGLGRYGDPLAPDGDMLTVDEWLTWLKPAYTIDQTSDPATNQTKTKPGSLLFSLPIGPDLLIWNMGRRYGVQRLPLMLENVKVLSRWGFDATLLTTPADYRKRLEAAFHVRPKKTVDLSSLSGGEAGEPLGEKASVETKQEL